MAKDILFFISTMGGGSERVVSLLFVPIATAGEQER